MAAGDIAACSTSRDEATATLLDSLAGTVVTLGDNAYESGTTQELAACYKPTLGRHKSRTRTAAGNHSRNCQNWHPSILAGNPTRVWRQRSLFK